MQLNGQCHCGSIQFSVEAPEQLELYACNCSICHMTGFLHLIVVEDDFTLIAGEDDLTTYTFNTKTAKHTFCKNCGVKAFYRPRSHPEDYSVNARCLDKSRLRSAEIKPFDGENWEDQIHTIKN